MKKLLVLFRFIVMCGFISSVFGAPKPTPTPQVPFMPLYESARAFPGNSEEIDTIRIFSGDGKNVFEIKRNGDIYYKGHKLKSNKQVYEALCRILDVKP